MPQEQPSVQSAAPRDGEERHASNPPQGPGYGGFEEDEEWLDDPAELPPRPRRRLLGAGGNPLAVTLLGVLLIACGFIGGVLVEKGETSSSSAGGAGAGLASRFAALRGASTAGATRSSSTGGAGGFFGAGAGAAGRATAGTVAYLDGSTLYVTNSEGNTIKVKTSPATSVSKTATSSVKGIHPGETVTITGSTGSNGAVSAESISVGSSGAGLAALFGSPKSGSGATSSSGGETPALFGG